MALSQPGYGLSVSGWACPDPLSTGRARPARAPEGSEASEPPPCPQPTGGAGPADWTRAEAALSHFSSGSTLLPMRTPRSPCYTGLGPRSPWLSSVSSTGSLVQMGAREHLLSQCDRDSFPGLPPETFGFAQKC